MYNLVSTPEISYYQSSSFRCERLTFENISVQGRKISNAKELIKGNSYVENAKNGALKALDIIEEAIASGKMSMPEMELSYIPVLRDELHSIPVSEDDFIEMMLPQMDQSKFILSEYGL